MSLAAYVRSRTKVKKVLIVGSGAVGKTSLLKVLRENKALEENNHDLKYHRTPFLEFETLDASDIIEGMKGTLQIYDTAGQ